MWDENTSGLLVALEETYGDRFNQQDSSSGEPTRNSSTAPSKLESCCCLCWKLWWGNKPSCWKAADWLQFVILQGGITSSLVSCSLLMNPTDHHHLSKRVCDELFSIDITQKDQQSFRLPLMLLTLSGHIAADKWAAERIWAELLQ